MLLCKGKLYVGAATVLAQKFLELYHATGLGDILVLMLLMPDSKGISSGLEC